MRKLIDSLTSRRASIALMIFIAAAGAIGAWVPQRGSISAAQYSEWSLANPTLASVYSALGFDRLFSTWWFRAALAVFLLSLSVATWRMVAATWRRVRTLPSRPGNSVPAGIPDRHATVDDIATRARAAGFREYSSADGVRVFWRHRIGLWGPAVMHAGMVIAAVAAIAASSFTTRAVADLSVGEVFSPGDEFLVAEGGVLDKVPDLGTPMRLDEVTRQEWPNGELKTVTARISFMDESRGWVAYEGSPNAPLRFRGHTVYVQAGEAGEAVFVTIVAPDGTETRLRLEFGFSDGAAPGYTDMQLADGTVIKARWDPLALKGSKPLAIRIGGEDGDVPAMLAEGEVATAEGYEVELLQVGQWARLIVVRPYGIDVLFVGFGIIGLGSLMLYVWIPRQLTIAREPDGGFGESIRYSWRVSRMARAFDAERDVILGITREETT